MFRWKARTLADAKAFIRLQTNLKSVELNKGDVVYREGDMGKSMYFVDEERGGKCYLSLIFLIILSIQFQETIHLTKTTISLCMCQCRRRAGS
jgi:hypothetical protein